MIPVEVAEEFNGAVPQQPSSAPVMQQLIPMDVELAQINSDNRRRRSELSHVARQRQGRAQQRVDLPVPPLPPPAFSSRGRQLRPNNNRYAANTVKVAGRRYCGVKALRACDVKIPKSLNHLARSLQKDQWWAAVESEMTAMVEFKVAKRVKRPVGKEILPAMWVFDVKTDEQGMVSKFKARFCARGDRQTVLPGVPIYSPVCPYDDMRVVLHLADRYRAEGRQFDWSNAFFNGTLPTPVYVEDPLDPHGDYVLLVEGNLYGLKEAPRVWYEKLKVIMRGVGLVPSVHSPAIFVPKKKTKAFTVAIAYVDDVLFFSNDKAEFKRVVKGIEAGKLVKSTEIDVFLGFKLRRDKDGCTMDARRKIESYVEELGLSFPKNSQVYHPNHVPTTAYAINKVEKGDCPPELQYKSLVGKLLHLALTVRPDISFAVSYLAKFCECYSVSAWDEAVKVLRYLYNTSNCALALGGGSAVSPVQVSIYADSSYADDTEHGRTQRGAMILMDGAAVSWSSNATRTTRSTMTAELEALASGVELGFSVCSLLDELKVPYEVQAFTDSAPLSKKLSDLPNLSGQERSVRVNMMYVYDKIEEGAMKLKLVSGDNMLADPLTKQVDIVKNRWFTSNIFIRM